MLFVWEAWPWLLTLIVLLIYYAIDILSLVMTAWSGLSCRIYSVDSVSFVYMVTREFPYAWLSDLFRLILYRCYYIWLIYDLMLIYACWALWYVVMNCLVIWIITWLWYFLGGVASTIDTDCTADLLCYCCIVIGYECLLGTVPSTLCHLCIWLRESFHMHGRRICSARFRIVDVIFDWYMIWCWNMHVVHCWYVIMNC